jgi:hypothetical protein
MMIIYICSSHKNALDTWSTLLMEITLIMSLYKSVIVHSFGGHNTFEYLRKIYNNLNLQHNH